MLFILNKLLNNIVIVGRPNVGKSTLFNTMLREKTAITGPEFGLTRDYQEGVCKLKDIEFLLIDTAGFNTRKNSLKNQINSQILKQISRAHFIFFVVDCSINLTTEDKDCWNLIRKSGKEIVLIANKSELKGAKNYLYQLDEFGLDECIQTTALSKNSLNIIYNVLKNKIPKINKSKQEENIQNTIRISIAGKPNVGKSTLYNMLYGQERVITAPISGTTRDSIMSVIEHKRFFFEIIDTAGLRKRGKLNYDLEKASAYFSRKEIRYSNCVILVLDSQQPISNQDLFLSNYIIKEGRSILLIFNKWDLIKDKKAREKELLLQIKDSFFDAKGVNVLFISSLDSLNRDKVLNKIISVYINWNKKISTSELNKWLEYFWKYSGNQKYSGSLKFKYISQSKIRPPTFSLYHNKNSKVPKVTRRYIINQIREAFKLEGTPIRVNLRSADNPYIKKKK